MRRQTVIQIVSALIGILLAFSAGEIFVRAVNGWYSRSSIDQGLYVQDGRLGWRLAENAAIRQVAHDFDIVYHTDAFGRRVTKNQSESGRRIFVYGDSFTFGIGLKDEDTFSSQLAKQLDSSMVINRGVSGYAPDQYYLSFAQDIVENHHAPDLAIFAILPANDLEDINHTQILGFSPGQDRGVNKPHLERDGKSFKFIFPKKQKENIPKINQPESGYTGIVGLIKQSALLRFMYFRLTEFEPLGFMKKYAQEVNSESVNLLELDEARQRLGFLIREVRKTRVPTIYMLIPSENLLLNKANGTKEYFAYNYTRQILRENGALFIDMLDHVPAKRGYYFPNESHWTAEGATLAAKALAATVKSIR